MTFLKYITLVIPILASSILAQVANYWASRHLDEEGNLIYLRGWLQPPDMSELWGPDWDAYRSGLTKSQAVLMYLKRNPGQGLDQLLAANVTMRTQCKVRGNINIGDKESA